MALIYTYIGTTMTLIILLYALFGSSFPICKVLLNYTTPLFLLGSRLLVAGPILLMYHSFINKKPITFKWSHLSYFLQLTILGMYLNYLIRFWALHDLPSLKVSFLFNLSPFFSALYSYFFFKEKMSKLQWIGLVIGFTGLIPLMLTTTLAEQELGEFFLISWQELAVLTSVALHSYCWILIRKLVKDKQYTPMMVNGISMTCGGLMALCTSMIVDGPFPVTNVAGFVKWSIVIILISNIICHNLYAFLLRKYTATFLSFAGFLSPLFSALYGWGLLGETITWHFFASALLVFIGLYLFYREELIAHHPNPLE